MNSKHRYFDPGRSNPRRDDSRRPRGEIDQKLLIPTESQIEEFIENLKGSEDEGGSRPEGGFRGSYPRPQDLVYRPYERPSPGRSRSPQNRRPSPLRDRRSSPPRSPRDRRSPPPRSPRDRMLQSPRDRRLSPLRDRRPSPPRVRRLSPPRDRRISPPRDRDDRKRMNMGEPEDNYPRYGNPNETMGLNNMNRMNYPGSANFKPGMFEQGMQMQPGFMMGMDFPGQSMMMQSMPQMMTQMMSQMMPQMMMAQMNPMMMQYMQQQRNVPSEPTTTDNWRKREGRSSLSRESVERTNRRTRDSPQFRDMDSETSVVSNDSFMRDKSPPIIDKSEWKKSSRIPTPPPPPTLSECLKTVEKQSPQKTEPPQKPKPEEKKETDIISALLGNKDVSLSSLLEAAMETKGSKKHTEDPEVKRRIIEDCERKISQLYRMRMHGEGAFIPDPIPQVYEKESDMLNTHPYLEFVFESKEKIWRCPNVKTPVVNTVKQPENTVENAGKSIPIVNTNWDSFSFSSPEKSHESWENDQDLMPILNIASQIPTISHPFNYNPEMSFMEAKEEKSKKKNKKKKKHRSRSRSRSRSRKKSRKRSKERRDSPVKMRPIIPPESIPQMVPPPVNIPQNFPNRPPFIHPNMNNPNPRFPYNNWNLPPPGMPNMVPNPMMMQNPPWMPPMVPNMVPNVPNMGPNMIPSQQRPVSVNIKPIPRAVPPPGQEQASSNIQITPVPVPSPVIKVGLNQSSNIQIKPVPAPMIGKGLNQPSNVPVMPHNPLRFSVPPPHNPHQFQPYMPPMPVPSPHTTPVQTEEEKSEEEMKKLKKEFLKNLSPIEDAIDELINFQRNESTCASIKYRILSGNQVLTSMYTIVNEILCRVNNVSKTSKCIQVIVPKNCMYKSLVAAHNANHKLRLQELTSIIEKCYYAVTDVAEDLRSVFKMCSECNRTRSRSRERKNELFAQRPGAIVLPKIKVNLKSKSSNNEDTSERNFENRNRSEMEGEKDLTDDLLCFDKTTPRRRNYDSFNVYRQQMNKKQLNPDKKDKLYDESEDTIDLTFKNETREKKKYSMKNIPIFDLDEDEVQSPKRASTSKPSKKISPKENDQLDNESKSQLDFKTRVRQTQILSNELKTIIERLEKGDEGIDPSYLIKGTMLCQKIMINGSSEVRIVADMEHIRAFCYIVHTMAVVHAPYQKSLAMFKKHFIPIVGIEDILSNVVISCHNCRLN